MADVFISYHRSEGTSALVRRIADELNSNGISCWYDMKDATPGSFLHSIQREISHCKVFLLIWDEGTNNSEWCINETYAAFDGKNHPVRIPFQIGDFKKDTEMDFYMRRSQVFYGGDSLETADTRNLISKIVAVCNQKAG